LKFVVSVFIDDLVLFLTLSYVQLGDLWLSGNGSRHGQTRWTGRPIHWPKVGDSHGCQKLSATDM